MWEQATASVDMEAGKQYANSGRVPHETTGQAKMQLALESPVTADAGIEEAAAAAKKSDVAVVVVGDCPEIDAEQQEQASTSPVTRRNWSKRSTRPALRPSLCWSTLDL